MRSVSPMKVLTENAKAQHDEYNPRSRDSRNTEKNS